MPEPFTLDDQGKHMAIISKRPPFRADHVGSLMRSARLLQARIDHCEGRLTLAALNAIEDEEVRAAVAMQERCGLRCITEGELRRRSWRDDFFDNVDGFTPNRFRSPFTFTQFSGEKVESGPIPHVMGRFQTVHISGELTP
ncbi:MAG: hypothetical protein FJY55_11775 [Betaproteobacteria bacterium]|nr:hypothetical protein [Betaproteobacteria bacterium]